MLYQGTPMRGRPIVCSLSEGRELPSQAFLIYSSTYSMASRTDYHLRIQVYMCSLQQMNKSELNFETLFTSYESSHLPYSKQYGQIPHDEERLCRYTTRARQI